MATKKNSYPLLILLLIGSFLCFSVWSAMRAIDAGPEVTDADYYSKGLRYNSTLLDPGKYIVDINSHVLFLSTPSELHHAAQPHTSHGLR